MPPFKLIRDKRGALRLVVFNKSDLKALRAPPKE